MKTKTQDLTGPALDWAVAKAYGMEFSFEESPLHEMTDWQPSTEWALAGPIIERERIELRGDGDGGWIAYDNLTPEKSGPTPLIAAMRCYVASKLGDTVEVPEGLQ